MTTDGWKPSSPLTIWEDATFAAQVEELQLEVLRLDAVLHFPDVPIMRIIFTIDYDQGSCTLKWIERAV